jgi:DtxR family Mn-dependent transcriptional regulator
MGHPVYDPHGDPIPTAAGQLPPRTGVTVAALTPGQPATIVHLEDEPREVYERLVAAGLAPGARLQLLEATSERVRLVVDGAEHVLPPVVAANITVARVSAEGPEAEAPRTSLADLRPGESGVVQEIAPACPGPQRRRLLDLGLVPGTLVRAELRGAIAGPVVYEIRGALIALRREQAEMVRVERSARPTSAEVA